MFGWAGKILHVDLTKMKVDQISTQPYAEKYLGLRFEVAKKLAELENPVDVIEKVVERLKRQ